MELLLVWPRQGFSVSLPNTTLFLCLNDPARRPEKHRKQHYSGEILRPSQTWSSLKLERRLIFIAA
jgi:hypothetical protein